jgi:uncharacterized Zn finger protein
MEAVGDERLSIGVIGTYRYHEMIAVKVFGKRTDRQDVFNQNRTFKANCTCRPVFIVEEIWPKFE